MLEPSIHPTAVISPNADVGSDCEIGPYCFIGDNVRIGKGNLIHSHVVVDGHTTIGDECEIFSFACIGKQTQDLKYKGEVTYVEIGDRNMIREYVTVHSATSGGNKTVIGDDCLIQAYCHVAHECRVGNGVIMSSGAMISGHVEIGDRAIIGGYAGAVQFAHVGTMAMVGGYSKLTQDVMPFTIADGMPAEARAVNRIGMKRNGLDKEAIAAVESAFTTIFKSNLTTDEATKSIREEFPGNLQIAEILDFIENSTRGLARPKNK